MITIAEARSAVHGQPLRKENVRSITDAALAYFERSAWQGVPVQGDPCVEVWVVMPPPLCAVDEKVHDLQQAEPWKSFAPRHCCETGEVTPAVIEAILLHGVYRGELDPTIFGVCRSAP